MHSTELTATRNAANRPTMSLLAPFRFVSFSPALRFVSFVSFGPSVWPVLVCFFCVFLSSPVRLESFLFISFRFSSFRVVSHFRVEGNPSPLSTESIKREYRERVSREKII